MTPLLSPPPPCYQILETGQEIMELDSSGFYTDIATVFAGNIGDDRFIVQVTATSVILMKSSKSNDAWSENYLIHKPKINFVRVCT